MRVYLSCSSKKQGDPVWKHVRTLSEMGHDPRTVIMPLPDDTAQAMALARMQTVAKCDLLVLFTDPKPDPDSWVEFGAAIGMNKVVVIIGRRFKTIGHLPNLDCFATFEEFLDSGII